MMSEVDFEEQNWNSMRPTGESGESSGGSAMIKLIIKLGLAKDSKRANYVLVIAAVAILLISFIVFLSV